MPAMRTLCPTVALPYVAQYKAWNLRHVLALGYSEKGDIRAPPFDKSMTKDLPFVVKPGKPLTPCWEEIAALMVQHDIFELYCPSELVRVPSRLERGLACHSHTASAPLLGAAVTLHTMRT